MGGREQGAAESWGKVSGRPYGTAREFLGYADPGFRFAPPGAIFTRSLREPPAVGRARFAHGVSGLPPFAKYAKDGAPGYMQRILEDLYDDRITVEAILIAKGRLAAPAPAATAPAFTTPVP